jgi:AcrR family transcriptional regulator
MRLISANLKLAAINQRGQEERLSTPTIRRPSADRRAQIRRVAAELFATNGFHGVSIEDIGSACGMSGPALYKHFRSKDAILADLLLGISEHLLAGGKVQVAATPDPEQALAALISFHLDFALTDPDLIRVHDRDLANLGAQARRVRRLQRSYVEIWRVALQDARPHLTDAQARARIHAVFGLLNSTPHSAAGLDPATMREILTHMATAALAA